MTGEEAINFLKGYLDEEVYTEKCRNAHEMAIKALEQQSCDDVISRQAAIDALDKRFDSIPMEQTTEILLLRKDLRDLPIRTARAEIGRWISLDDFRGKYNENGFMCSECGTHSDFEENFCPNCGAKMLESEDEE